MEEKLVQLQGGIRQWWDVHEKRKVSAAVLYLAQGCPDWGERDGKRNSLCTFCALPHAARLYREAFYGGVMSQEEHARLFLANLDAVAPPSANIHTLMIFNAGSFLAAEANAPDTRSSAGAYALATYYHSKAKDRIHEGLGIVPMRVVCHYQSTLFKKKDDPIALMEKYSSDLELVVLRDCEWRTFTM